MIVFSTLQLSFTLVIKFFSHFILLEISTAFLFIEVNIYLGLGILSTCYGIKKQKQLMTGVGIRIENLQVQMKMQ